MQQFISSMKDKNIKYLYDARLNRVKGLFTGIQFKQVVNTYIGCDCNIVINKQQQEIEYLKKELAELKAKFENNTPKKPKGKITKKESKIEIEPTVLFSNDDLMDSFNESINDLM